jgi:hypothetical protein
MVSSDRWDAMMQILESQIPLKQDTFRTKDKIFRPQDFWPGGLSQPAWYMI